MEQYMVLENIPIHCMVTGKSKSWGFSKAKFFTASMKLTWNLQKGGGRDLNQKTIHDREGVMDNFWNHTNVTKDHSFLNDN